VIIGGFTKLSTVDWPGRVAAVIFTRGCNFCCPWCHNKELVLPEIYAPEIPEEKVLGYLSRRSRYLDGVVVTGGEPTIHEDLPAFLKKIKILNLPVKLDSNGSRPEMLKKVIDMQLVDALALDLKAAPGNYRRAVGVEVNESAIWSSFRISAKSGLPVTFRTTIVPGLHLWHDIDKIGRAVQELIQINPKTVVHVYQKFRPAELGITKRMI